MPYRDDEDPGSAPVRDKKGGIFRRPYDAQDPEKPREREKRIKFEVLDDSAESLKKRTGFNPYDSTKKPPPRR